MHILDTNVLGKPLQPCCHNPQTGYLRDGYCQYLPSDIGEHTVCARVTEAFLEFSARQGNDLSTPNPAMGFPGLKAGERWCLCTRRWLQAHQAGCAPPVVLQATHEQALDRIPLELLRAHAAETDVGL